MSVVFRQNSGAKIKNRRAAQLSQRVPHKRAVCWDMVIHALTCVCL